MLDHSMNVPRYNHQMVTLGQQVFVLGGQRQPNNDSTLDVIEVFDLNSESWSEHTSSLLSKSTDDLAVTELPISAVSCNQGCQCGVRSYARIVGGEEAEVKFLKIAKVCFFVLFHEQTCSRFTRLFVRSFGWLSPCQKYLKNPYNAIFLKSQGSKDIKNDILDSQIHKYTNTNTQMLKYTKKRV